MLVQARLWHLVPLLHLQHVQNELFVQLLPHICGAAAEIRPGLALLRPRVRLPPLRLGLWRAPFSPPILLWPRITAIKLILLVVLGIRRRTLIRISVLHLLLIYLLSLWLLNVLPRPILLHLLLLHLVKEGICILVIII